MSYWIVEQVLLFPLLWAAANRGDAVVKVLLERGVDVNSDGQKRLDTGAARGLGRA